MNRLMVEQAGSRFFGLASSLGRMQVDTLTGLANVTAKTPLGPVFAINASVARMINESVESLAHRLTCDDVIAPEAETTTARKTETPKAAAEPAKQEVAKVDEATVAAASPAPEPEAHEVLVEEVAVTEVEAITEADDLTAISGIGATTAKKLDGAGITRFADIAAMNEGDFAELLASLDIRSIRFSPAKWIEEAKTFSVKN